MFAALVVVWVWLRVSLAAASMSYDEMASLFFAGQPWGHLWGGWMVRETNPPLFYSVLKLWGVGGHWWLRALPLGIAGVTAGVFGRFVWRRMGAGAALLGLAVLAVNPADIEASGYLRGYGLAMLAVLVSFGGLIAAIEGRQRGWIVYALGAVVAIHCHTTMVLWPVIATVAAMFDALVRRDWDWRMLGALVLADVASAVGSAWVIAMTWAQLHGGHVTNIAWLVPLSPGEFAQELNLQLLANGWWSSAWLGLLAVLGVVASWARREVRLALWIVLVGVGVFKACDGVHPIISDFTLHWMFPFVALAASGVAVWLRPVWLGGMIAGLSAVTLAEHHWWEHDSAPQDLRMMVETVRAHPGAVLLTSHESDGVVIEQACLVYARVLPCPFPVVVMTDPRTTDNWSFGGYHGHLVPPDQVRAALGDAREVYAFSRYFYTPLQHLGLDPGDWHETFWDDGELIGPIPVDAFDPPEPGEPPRVPNYNDEYTGGPD